MPKVTRVINVGKIKMGGESPIVIQSMTNTPTKDIRATVAQIKALESVGCELVRVAVPCLDSAKAISEIKKQINIPIEADIHFDYKLAVESIRHGADKIRINPGTLGGLDKIKHVVDVAKEYKIPIRVGLNSGSVEKDILKKHGGVTAEGLTESTERSVKILEDLGFYDICISVKCSNVPMTIETNLLLAKKFDYPIHIGITESGTIRSGSIKSAVRLGTLLHHGIGDTIRVSLTGDPVEEIYYCKQILSALDLRKFGVEVISCPTCARTEVDLIPIANEVEKQCAGINKHIKVAVMGCAVNGPGEASQSDIGIACGRGQGVLFKNGKVLKTVSENKMVDELMKEINKMAGGR
ncbi:MAG: flavodoxin-dependent (E)-4-hydroxy-3-methylbut-2-enyl-diphosphate synthase [Firmicutes bacterium]|nr:flavodoxin-dependent (E)-4-hydroxy-3-methylbut-2-enyl-diphosphate synthase [Bacillota bacterium]